MSPFAERSDIVELISYNEYEIVFSAPTAFIRDWIIRDYLNGTQKIVNGEKIWVKKGIKQFLLDFYPKLMSVDIVVDSSRKIVIDTSSTVINTVEDTNKNRNTSNTASFSENDNSFSIGTDLNIKYTFENFVVGSSNKLAYSVAKSIVDNGFSSDTNPLFLYGGVGLGKTHLCQAMAWGLKDKYPNKQIIYLSAEKSYASNSLPEYVKLTLPLGAIPSKETDRSANASNFSSSVRPDTLKLPSLNFTLHLTYSKRSSSIFHL